MPLMSKHKQHMYNSPSSGDVVSVRWSTPDLPCLSEISKFDQFRSLTQNVFWFEVPMKVSCPIQNLLNDLIIMYIVYTHHFCAYRQEPVTLDT